MIDIKPKIKQKSLKKADKFAKINTKGEYVQT